jgi:outer membrane protein assembly factor BamD (BamD/ComL family)
MVYTKKKLFSFVTIVIGLLLLLTSCATKVDPLTENLSLEGYFQKGMEAMDKNHYDVALHYYQAVAEKFPEDINGKLWASYEIAFIYHKMHQDEKALQLLNQLIELYKQNDKNDYPRAPLILAEKIKTKLEVKKQPQEKTASKP